MLKLKYLYNNRDLAHMVLSNWENDHRDSDSLNYYRISSNAVYWVQNSGTTFFLRFAPSEEKSRESILAELEFLRYLRNNDYPAVRTILSKSGNELEEVNTPWGTYLAVAFERAPGKQISEFTLTEDIIYGYGKSLGRLHRLSNEYKPTGYQRNSWKEILDWVAKALLDFPDEAAAKTEVSILRNYFEHLTLTKSNFGLIHYDFEPDNVFYDDITKTYNSIDFDDSMYHWYAMDIEQALDSLKDEVPQEKVDISIDQFIKGYRSEHGITDDMLEILPVFRRFADLYGYTRVLRSQSEKWDNEPEWMTNLRIKLNASMNRRKDSFAKSI